MSTTQDDIRGWLMRGKRDGATHMLVVCDTFDYEDYPVYVKRGEDVREEIKKYDNVNMQRVMEVYNLELPFDEQINTRSAWNL